MGHKEPGETYGSAGGWSEVPTEDAPSSVGNHPFGTADIARYRLGATLGIGGMGHVRAAWDRRLRRDVAYKEVRQAAEGHVARRLAREAWITANLEHPGIVPVYDAGQDPEGRLFYTMRLVRGRTLEQALQDSPDRRALLRAFLAVCETMAYAHARGVVHRDLKPANIMVGEFGEAQVVDWGLARGIEEEDEPEQPWHSDDPALTRLGAVVGTPAYMSPEQARGQRVGPQSDVWSLGAILYQLLTGQAPFHADKATTSLERAREGRIAAVRSRTPDASPELAAIAERALAADPVQRYSDASALAEDLARYLDGHRVSAYDYSPAEVLAHLARRYRAPLAVAVAAVVLGLAGGTVGVVRISQERDRAVTSEARAAESLALANRQLALTLVEQAIAAARDDDRPKAERLAAESLLLADSPEARGVLARFAAIERPIAEATTPLPDCARRLVFGPDYLLCLQPEHTSLFHTGADAPLWTVPFPITDAWLSAEHNTVLVLADRFPVWLDLTDGQELARSPRETNRDIGFVGALGHPQVEWLGVRRRSLYDLRARTEVDLPTPCEGDAPATLRTRSPDGAWMLWLCGESEYRVAPTGGPVHAVWDSHKTGLDGVTAMAWTETPSALAIADARDTLRLHDPFTGTALTQPTPLGTTARGMQAAGTAVAIEPERGGAQIFDTRSGARVTRLPEEAGWVAYLDPDGRSVWTLSDRLHRWRLPTSPQVSRLRADGGLTSALPSPDGKTLAVAGGSGFLRRFDPGTGLPTNEHQDLPYVVKSVAFGQDGTIYAAVAGAPALVALRPEATTWQVEYHGGGARRVAVLADGALVLLSYGDMGPDLLLDGKHEYLRQGTFHDIAVPAAGDVAYLAKEDGSLWTLASGSHAMTHLFDEPDSRSIAVSADGSRLVVATSDALQLRDATGAILRSWPHAGESSLDVALSPDHRWLAAADLDGAIYVYAQADGALRAVMPYHDQRASSVAFAPNGELLSAGWDAQVLRYGLQVLDQSPDALSELIEATWGSLGRRPMPQSAPPLP